MAQTESIGERVRLLREKRGWTQEDLAKALGQGRSSIKNKELDERSFSIPELKALSDIFGVSTDWLIRGVMAENLDVYRSLGLNDEAINGIREHNAMWVAADSEANPPIEKDFVYTKSDSALNAALASPAILQALSDYMGFTAESNDLSVGKAEQGGGYVNCRMSDGMYQAVLGQNLLRIIDAVKRGERPKLITPGLVFEPVEEGGEADGEEK